MISHSKHYFLCLLLKILYLVCWQTYFKEPINKLNSSIQWKHCMFSADDVKIVYHDLVIDNIKENMPPFLWFLKLLGSAYYCAQKPWRVRYKEANKKQWKNKTGCLVIHNLNNQIGKKFFWGHIVHCTELSTKK